MSTGLTIAETKQFQSKAENLLSEVDRNSLINYLALHPESGIVMRGTGGIRKIRWARENKGKSGGVRVIYYYYNQDMPLFLLTLFGKNEKANLSQAECNELAKLTKFLREQYSGGDK